LKSANFITVITDTSNRKHRKLLPILARCFIRDKGVVTFKLHIKEIKDEKSDTIAKEIIESAREWKIEEKIVCLAADNIVTNFGGVTRGGSNNVFHRLKSNYGRELLGIGCNAHIVHNAFDAACNKLDFDIEAIVVKIYKHFHIYTVRVESLTTFCDNNEVQFSMLKSHSSTRFLSLYPAIQQIIVMFQPLLEYFRKEENAPETVVNFLRGETSLFWLKFLENQLELSNETILKIENSHGAAFEVAEEIGVLKSKVKNRKEQRFIPSKAREIFKNFSDELQSQLNFTIEKFYWGLHDYTLRWSESLDGTEVFSWLNLVGFPRWDQIEASVDFTNKKTGEKINGDKLFDEITLIKDFVQENSANWTREEITNQEKWLKIFQRCRDLERPIEQLSLLVEYAFCLPGTSTEVERLFSIINDTWGNDKSQMRLESVEALLNVQFNTNLSCTEFFEKIKDDKNLLEQARRSQKYV
jgi:hypothetical protein